MNSTLETPTQSRASRYLDGVRWTLVTNCAGAGFAALSAIVIARVLDPVGYGRFRTITYLAGLCAAVAGFELRDAMRRFVPQLRKNGSDRTATAVVSACGIVAVVSILLAAALYSLSSRVALNVYRDSSLVSILRWTGLLVAASAAATLMEAVLTGFELYKATTARSLLAQSFGVPLQIVLAWKLGVWGAVSGFAIVAGARAGLLGFVVIKVCGTHALSKVNRADLLAMSRQLLRFSLPLLVTALLIPLANWWVSARLAAHRGMQEVGLFAVAYGLVQILTTVMLAAAVPLIPVLAEASTSAPRDTLNRIISRGTLTIGVLLFIPALVIGSNAHALILLVYGDRFAAAASVLFQFALACLPISVVEGLNRTAIATGYVRVVVGGHIAWLVVIISAVELYGCRHGALGCAMSLLAAEFVQGAYLVAVCHLCLEFDMAAIVKFVALSVAGMIPAYYLSSMFSPWATCASMMLALAILAVIWRWLLIEPDRNLMRNWINRASGLKFLQTKSA